MTQVKFLIEKDSTDVFAFFPEMDYNKITDYPQKVSYSHIGQHSACHIDYANECKEAIHREYCDLLRELVGQGYKDLQVLNKEQIKCWRNPTPYEIKFGEGAIHYRDFTLSEIGISKKGWIKSWFISKDDGLRYNHY